MAYNYEAPNLASILAGLASIAPQAQSQEQPQLSFHDTSHSQEYTPAQPQDQARYPQNQNAQHEAQVPPTNDAYNQILQQQLNEASRTSQAPALAATPTKMVDPATIIEWSAGLRCLLKTVARHEHVLNDIRRMIRVQHEHEEQWFKGREALLEKQKSRKEGQKRLDEVFKAIGGAVTTAPAPKNSDELARELQTFDMKVYRAQMEMTREMTSKLRGMGVPFFGTKTELVRPRGLSETSGSGPPKDKDEKGMIDEIELVKLQRKMLAMLEDLCSD
ncbi:hypothetical protein BJ875DRAFT_30934 [Amylocarpus encephaloides]|uniref:Uncharacterized protein n=1 Tax=Amylocarpus encephaloides TaxID=45428 RepID=A0A9P7YIV6_9HELO|nr:hypothetical protein BJ875DRAFT_30934 [Amylocarpus encephaloides]